jgi:hypothetical protein
VRASVAAGDRDLRDEQDLGCPFDRKRRLFDAKKWTAEIFYAVTDPAAEQADPAETAACPETTGRSNSVHWIRDVVFGEDARKIRTRNTPAVMATLGDIVRSTLRAAGWTNTASARRAHTDPATILELHGIT